MKEVPLSLCERSSLVGNLKAQIRGDGRNFMEMRHIEVHFGKEYGCSSVLLGETRVLAQVTSEVVEPRPSRPNEGKLSIAIHLSPMAASHFEPGRGNEIMDELQQILDRNIKESRCVDLESLCILAEENVWQLKVDVTVLNHAGNLGDACNLAAVAALRHFHRPDVTVEEDGRVTIHTKEERELIPTFLKKIPVCLTHALFMVDKQCITILDPTEKEERVMSGKFIVGLNPHGEITSLLFPGKMCLEKHHVMRIISRAFLKAKALAETVLNLVEEDLERRRTSIQSNGFLNSLKSDAQYSKNLLKERVEGTRKLVKDSERFMKDESMEVKEDEEKPSVSTQSKDTSESDSSDEEFSQESLAKTLPEIRAAKKKAQLMATTPDTVKMEDEEVDTKGIKLSLNDG